ncbi:HesB/IscA family protein [Fodinibius halophilus]|uniref:Iron-sulfur cluster assembly accessory protein n=1 Tax=Fodinibius halophilus TaxID=1736908 RepID=A0A6M1SUU5_9BACT|nr:iron-sulfur cluster assembly accessory protein [Fodinibius halophilus]NGP87346.1 iron-sulfur cluster assembly accessory protein [Fodinibius halophilus]
MPVEEENLDDVISDLVDEDTGDDNGETGIQGLPTPDDVEFSGPPVSLTERAAEQVRNIREDESLEDDLKLRVAVEGGGCSGLSYKLGFDHKTEDDEVVVSQGIEIVVDPKHMMYLKGISVDYPDGLDARGFTFDNPNASETCGCGSSFAT